MPRQNETIRPPFEAHDESDRGTDDTSVPAAVAWLAGGRDTLVGRLVDEIPDMPDHVLYPLRFALTSATAGTVDPRWAYGYAAGVAAQAGLTWTAAVLQRFARWEGWVTPGPPWSPLDVNVVVTVADAVDRAVEELARVCVDPAIDAAEVWVAGGLAELTARLARAVKAGGHNSQAVWSLRTDLAAAAGGMASAARDDALHSDIVWTLGRACGLAKALDLDRTDVAILSLSVAYRDEPMLPREPFVSTVDAVEIAVDELRERFGDG